MLSIALTWHSLTILVSTYPHMCRTSPSKSSFMYYTVIGTKTSTYKLVTEKLSTPARLLLVHYCLMTVDYLHRVICWHFFLFYNFLLNKLTNLFLQFLNLLTDVVPIEHILFSFLFWQFSRDQNFLSNIYFYFSTAISKN